MIYMNLKKIFKKYQMLNRLILFGFIGLILLHSSHIVYGKEKYDNNNKERSDINKMESTNLYLKIISEEEIIIVKMDNNPFSKKFIEKLPMKLRVEDYVNTEKIAYLSEKLKIDNYNGGIEAKKGDFAYYFPWGNQLYFIESLGMQKGLLSLEKLKRELIK